MKNCIIFTVIIMIILVMAAFIVLFESFQCQCDKADKSQKDNVDNIEKFDIITRDVWLAHSPKAELEKLKLPIHRVIISNTNTELCFDQTACSERVREIQEYHMYSFKFDDIGYNFLIGGDGGVYEGRGWDMQGAHSKGYNHVSIGVSFIGTFTTQRPTDKQLEAAKLLLEDGVRLGKLSSGYRLYGLRQLGATESPGSVLYEIIKKWPAWSANV